MLKEYKRLLPYYRKYLPMYIPGLICLVVTDAGQLLIPQFTKQAVDAIADGSLPSSGILRLSVLMAITALLIAIGRFGWRYFIGGSARKIESGLRQRLFDHLLSLSPGFFGRKKTGDIMARFTNDMRAIRMACGMAIVSLVDGLFMAAFIFVILFRNYPSIAGWIIIPFPFLAFMVLGFGRLLGRRSKLVQEGFSDLSAAAQESLSGVRVFKTFSRESWAVRKFAGINDVYQTRTMSLVRIWGLFFPLINFLAGLTSLLLLWFGGRKVSGGELSPGDFAAVLSYLSLLVWPMMGAGFTVNWLERGAASLSRIGEFLDTEPEVRSGRIKRTAAKNIEIRNLSFSWPDDERPVLQNLSLTIEQGATVGILGRTGSGKSCLVGLLPRLYDPPPGTIFYGGEDVRDWELEGLRRSVGLVLQDSFLFSATVKENIAFAAPDADEDAVREAAAFSTIDRDLNEFPFGWDTMVGEKGHSLSGGQRQRVAISRAFLTDPDVLIFDDCLSAVDAETEAGIMRQFIEKRKGKTSIIISNRTGTLAHCDYIAVLEGGGMSAVASHRKLISRKGLYRDIYRLQQAENEK